MTHGELVEKELDAMIQRGARKGDVDPDTQRGTLEGEREGLHRPPARGDEGSVDLLP